MAGAKRIKNLLGVAALFALMALAIMDRPVAILLAIGLMPTVICWLMDNTHSLQLLRAVTPLNVATTIPYVILLLRGRNAVDQVATMFSSVSVWVALYAPALFGLMMFYTGPVVLVAIMQRRIDGRRRMLRAEQAELKEEWGEEVAAPMS